jgi:hypothetical protein
MSINWPPDVDCVVVPGIPGGSSTTQKGESAYPATTTDVLKLLREAGVRVDYVNSRERRAQVAYESDDVWLPILIFTRDALANGAGGLLANVIWSYLALHHNQTTRLHVRSGRVKANGKEEWYDGNGPASDVIRGLEIFYGRRD